MAPCVCWSSEGLNVGWGNDRYWCVPVFGVLVRVGVSGRGE